MQHSHIVVGMYQALGLLRDNKPSWQSSNGRALGLEVRAGCRIACEGSNITELPRPSLEVD